MAPRSPIVEGQTATNPATGEKIVYRGGKWYPANQPGAQGPMQQSTLSAQEQGDLTRIRTAAEIATAEQREAERFSEMNFRQPTGSGFSGPGGTIPRMAARMIPGSGTAFSGMEAVTARMAPGARVEGSGTTSDRDLSLYLQGGPSVDKPGQVNEDIIARGREETARRMARNNFFEQWATQNRSLVGAQEAFDRSYRPAANVGLPASQRSATALGQAAAAPMGGGLGASMRGRSPAANAPRTAPRVPIWDIATGTWK